MSDELDRELLSEFAKASEPLPDTQFHANVMLEVSRLSSPWRDLPHFIGCSLRSAGSGFLLGLRALFRALRFISPAPYRASSGSSRAGS
jgi:hypothetical protein